MFHSSRAARPGRLVLLAVTITVGISTLNAGQPPAGAAAEISPAPSGSAGPSVVPRASIVPSVDASPSAAASAAASVAPSAAPSPAPSAAPSVAPSVAPAPSPVVSPSPIVLPSVLPPSPPPSSAPASTPPSAAPAPAPARPPYPAQCVGWGPVRQRADLLLQNKFQINVHPIVPIPANPTWRENPLGDANWEYQFHSQWLVLSLLQTWQETGDARYRDRAAFLLRDWATDNPRSAPRSAWAWDPMGTALRAQVLACATRYLPMESWLAAVIDSHGRALAETAFYAKEGNHALNQNLGLLELGIARGRSDWRKLANERFVALFEKSVDSQGVTNEQSVYYQFYNWDRYRVAFGRFGAAGFAPPPSAARHKLMPAFLAHATLPNGEYEMIGDTDRMKARLIAGSAAEYGATLGASGTRPATTAAVYRAGWLFARSGWGERRPIADEVAISLRWGPAPIIHGHQDAGSITLYGFGARLLADPGKYTYNQDAWRTYFKSRHAHNVVTVDGVTYSKTAASSLLSHGTNATMVTARVKMTGNPGVVHDRGIVFSRNLHYTLVEDRLSSTTRRTFRQLWHLTPDGNPLVNATWFQTQRARGNVQVRQLIGGTTSRIVKGRTSPIQGWLAWEHGTRLTAPVVEVIRTGTTARYLTLLVPAAGKPGSGISELKLTSTGYSVVVKIGAKSERVVVSGSSVTVTPLN